MRMQFLRYDPNTNDIDLNEFITDGNFRDKLFIIIPQIKYVFYEEMKEHLLEKTLDHQGKVMEEEGRQ
jgi:hypothetical protein